MKFTSIAFLSIFLLQFSVDHDLTGMILQASGDTTIITQQGSYKFITEYANGEKNGKEYLLHNGDTIKLSWYKNDLIDGESLLLSTGQKIVGREYFDNGYRTGVWTTFDTLGNLTREIVYDKGYLWNALIWSGKITHYMDNKRICTITYTNTKKTSVIVYDKKRYKIFKKEDVARRKAVLEHLKNSQPE